MTPDEKAAIREMVEAAHSLKIERSEDYRRLVNGLAMLKQRYMLDTMTAAADVVLRHQGRALTASLLHEWLSDPKQTLEILGAKK